MIAQLGQTRRRLLAAVILVLVLAAGYLVTIRPVSQLHGRNHETIADLAFRIQRFERIAESQSASQAALDRLARNNPSARYYLTSTRPALAATELQQLVRNTIDRSEAQLISTQVITGQDAVDHSTATVRVRMSGDIGALQSVLYSLEAGKPLLFVDDVSIIASSMPRTSARAPQPGGGLLNISFDVSGYLRPHAAKQKG